MGRESRGVRSTSVAVIPLSILTSVTWPAPPDALPSSITITGSPLHIEVGHSMSMQVLHQDDERVATSSRGSL